MQNNTIGGYWAKQLGVLTAMALIIAWFFFHADFGYDFHWAVLYEENPTYKEVFGMWLLKGLMLTIHISLVSALGALVIGTLFGIGRLSSFKPVYYFTTAYVELFRNTPLLVQMFFWYFAFPALLPDSATSFLYAHNFEFIAAVVSLICYTGAYIAEIVRAGIQAIPPGHVEAGLSSGLTRLQVLRFITLPQAFRVIIPPLGSEFLNNMKNSSVAMTIGVAELCWQSQQIESFTFRGFEATSAASLIYLFLSILISFVMNSANHHLKVGSEKKLSIADRFIGGLILPVAWILKLIVSLLDIMTALIVDRFSPHISDPATDGLRPAVKMISTILIWLGKGIAVGFILLIIGLIVKGLGGFNWQVISSNLRSLLFWTFPTNASGELFYGMGGLSLSFTMALIVIFISFFIGIAVGLGRLSKNPIIQTPSILYIEIIRGNPLIMVIFWVYFFSPIITGVQMNVFFSATIAFIIFSGAYLAEIVRAGIEAIPPGQAEAARASGLNYFQAMRYVILPQALKIMIPAIVGQFITIFKDTSLAYIIGVFELTTVAQTVSNRLMIYPFEIYVTIGALYFICCYSMSLFAARLERNISA